MKQNLYSFLLLLVCSALVSTTQAQTPSYLKGSEVQAYNANTQQIKQFAQIAIGDEMANLIITYKLTQGEAENFKALVEEMETRLATYNVIYPTQDTIRFKAKMAVKESYKNTLVKTLFENDKMVGCYNLRMIRRNKDTLHLNADQQEKIKAMAVEVNDLLEKNPKMDLRAYELPRLTKIMTPQQFDLYLQIKLTDEVNTQTNSTWAKLKENGLEYGLDSTKTKTEVFNHHMAKAKANYIYTFEQKTRDAANKAIDEAAPTAIRRANGVADAVKAKNAYNGTLTW